MTRRARRTRAFRDRTGRLRASVRTVKDRRGLGYSAIAGGRAARHGRFIEFGTRYIRPRRFLFNAFQAVRPQVLRIIARRTRRNFNRQVRNIIRSR